MCKQTKVYETQKFQKFEPRQMTITRFKTQLTDAEEKAQQREEDYKKQIKQMTDRLKTAESR